MSLRLLSCAALSLSLTVFIAAAGQRPAPTVAFDHIHLAAPDPAQAAAWYTEHFNGGPAEFPGRVAFEPWVKRLPLPVQLVFTRTVGAPPSEGGAIERLGFSVADLDKKVAELNAAGIRTDWLDRTRETRALTHDPWGVTLEIVQDPRMLGLHHVVLRVRDVASTRDWYQAVFGGSKATVNGATAVRYQKMYLVIARGDGAPSKGRAFDHISWGPTDIAATVAAAKDRGGTVTSEVTGPNGLGHHMAFVEDPNHVSIELIQHDELLK